MKDKVESRHSGWLVSLSVAWGCLGAGVIFAFLGWIYPAGVLIFMFVLGMTARLWGKASSQKIYLKVSGGSKGMFPGEELSFDIEVKNDKILPVVWLDVFCPLSKELCIVPEESRAPDEWEKVILKEEGASEESVGEKHFPLLLWHESIAYSSKWTAQKRGVYSTEGWRLRTGDGFGLMQTERRISEEDICSFSVYPAIVPVTPEPFLRNRWTSDTGTKGIMKDPTLIRSSRGYTAGDPAKSINWRLTARGLPLSVNVYEDILPKSVHFVFDGESFSGPDKHKQEMEEALSILASEIIALCGKHIRCGLSLSRGERHQPLNRFGEEEPYGMLQMLAAYLPEQDIRSEEGSKIIKQNSVFDEAPVLAKISEAGRFYYITYDGSKLEDQGFIYKLGPDTATVLSYREVSNYTGFETLCLKDLKEGM
ncbi:MAG: DUF58 domain-containing protein [Firmicutes bacterium]|nr:DUF58 domain-containing protein [Bacillota bacterium]